MLVAVLIGREQFFDKVTAPFKINCSGGFLDWKYEIEIPQRYMSQGLADKHHAVFMNVVEDLATAQRERASERKYRPFDE